jgi:GntR family transcriptional regulator/MocR family aminotransferase
LIFQAAGAKLVPCPVDGEGLRIERLPASPKRVPLVYVTPSHQFPTGTVLPLSRRLALIEWARTHQSFILEDDYDGELRYDNRPIEAVQALDESGCVIYVGTVSKALSPELRVGYAVLPPALLAAFLAAKWATDLFAPTPSQVVLAEFFRDGHYDRHLRRLRDCNSRRRSALLAATKEFLGDRASVGGVSAGLHAMIWLPTVPLTELPLLIDCARRLGVTMYPVSHYYLGRPQQSGVLAGYSSLSEQEIRAGIELFGEALRSRW